MLITVQLKDTKLLTENCNVIKINYIEIKTIKKGGQAMADTICNMKAALLKNTDDKQCDLMQLVIQMHELPQIAGMKSILNFVIIFSENLF